MSTESVLTHALVFADPIDISELTNTSPTVSFTNTINTYDDWGLIPSKKPVIVLPPVKSDYTDVPGANGKLDLTDVLGSVTYDTREETLEFYVQEYKMRNGSRMTFEDLRREIANYLHGKRLSMYLESDPGVFYTGRWYLEETTTEESWSVVNIRYVLEPYGAFKHPHNPRTTF
jgi:hypothetical protein